MIRSVEFVILELTAGALSGLFGIGGGIIIVPALVLLFGLSQHAAQGTTLALMVPPIGILAAWTYLRNGDLNLTAAIFIGLGFVVGGYLGAKLAERIPDLALERSFGVVLIVIGVKMIASR